MDGSLNSSASFSLSNSKDSKALTPCRSDVRYSIFPGCCHAEGPPFAWLSSLICYVRSSSIVVRTTICRNRFHSLANSLHPCMSALRFLFYPTRVSCPCSLVSFLWNAGGETSFKSATIRFECFVSVSLPLCRIRSQALWNLDSF